MKVYRWENHGKSMKILELNGAFHRGWLFEKPETPSPQHQGEASTIFAHGPSSVPIPMGRKTQ